MTKPCFVHLRVHTEFSLIDSLVRVKELAKKAAACGMPAVAISDQSNLFALIKFYKAARGIGIKPILGVDLWLREDGETWLITLYAQNGKGYRNLTELVSKAYIDGQHHGVAYVQRDWISQYSEGLIALSGGKFGDVGRALLNGHCEEAAQRLAQWLSVFPDRFYLELQRTGREGDEDHLHAAAALAADMDCPVVATNDVRFIERSQFEAHEARVCIHDGRTLDDPRRERRYSEQQYFRSAEEMAELFSDIPEALENSVEIARRCSVDITLGKAFLPDYPVPEGMTMDQFYRKA